MMFFSKQQKNMRQHQTPSLDTEDEGTINRLFEELILDEMNLKDSAKDALRSKPKTDKLCMLKQKMKKSQKNDKNESASWSKYKTVSDYVTYLRNNSQEPQSIHSKELHECIKLLKIELRGNSVSWVRDFGANNGHIEILNIICLCSKVKQHNKKPADLLADCIQCLHSFMNNKVCIGQSY